jgi:hypothetical protein
MMANQSITRRRALALAGGLCASGLFRQARGSTARPAVVELFTSQACSSCERADVFMAELHRMPDVIALSYHVDYWDYLGWKDTLGSAEFSRRQYDYAKVRGDMDVYTPQLIIEGRKAVVGSARESVLAEVAKAQSQPAGVPLSIVEHGMEFIVEMGSGPAVDEATLWLIPVLAKVKVHILRGELAGKEIEYYNVARELLPAAMWNGTAKTVSLPKSSLQVDGSTACVALLQLGKVGPVLGAARIGEMRA